MSQKTITIRRLDLQFTANQDTHGRTAAQAEQMVNQINEILRPYGANAQLLMHRDEVEIEVEDSE